jgi:Leucine-rich repeat (LRR) protein
LEYLYDLNASDNQIADINMLTESSTILKFLQKVDLSKNKLTKLPQIVAPSIVNLNLDENEIAEIEFSKHPTIKVLSLNKNKLASGAGLCSLPCLEELSIQENETLTSIKGMDDMKCLRKLNLTGSKLESLSDLPNFPALEELILDGNAVASLDELPKLGHLTSLKKLGMAGTPLAEEKGDDLKKEVLIALMDKLKHLKEVNGEGWDDELMKESKETKEQRIQEAIEAAKAAEEAAKAAAENPEGGE